MSFYPTKNLTPEEKEKLQNDFDVLFANADGRDKLWDEFKKIFSTLSAEEIYNFSDTYTRWFTLLTWKKFVSLSFEEIMSVLDKVLVPGVLLGIDVWQTVIDYLNLGTLDKDDMERKYAQIKEKILTSKEIIIKRNDGSFYSVSDLANDLKHSNDMKDDLAFATIISNLSGFFTDRLKKLSLEVERSDDFVGMLKSCLDFLWGVEKDTIWYMVDAINYPVQYESAPGENLAPVEVWDNEKIADPEFADIEKTLDEIVDEEESTKSAEETPTSLDNKLPIAEKTQEDPYQTIKSQLEQKYSYDENGELSPIEEVLGDLSQMAEEKADENIEELYMFDEDAGKFVWNEDLLNQN